MSIGAGGWEGGVISNQYSVGSGEWGVGSGGEVAAGPLGGEGHHAER